MVTPRMQKVRNRMSEQAIDALFLTPSSNMKYVLGKSPIIDERLFVLVLAADREPFLLANALYAPEVAQMPVNDAIYWKDGQDPYPLLLQALKAREIPLGTVAVDQSLQAMFLLPLMAALPQTRFVPANPVLNALRVYKDPEERDAMREACRLADIALKNTIDEGQYWIGKTESEFFARLSFEMTSLGIDEPGACICAGANAASPHYTAGQAKIASGSCLLVDFGGTYKNYYTDMTRTFHFGEPAAEFRKVHDIVRQANAAGQKAARLGSRMEDVDIATRAVIEDAGYGEYFIHRTGHGIGIDVHESPNAALGEKAVIQPGMAFSIEPGIYLPGKFGVRIEDQALMTEDGVEILHAFPRELIVL